MKTMFEERETEEEKKKLVQPKSESESCVVCWQEENLQVLRTMWRILVHYKFEKRRGKMKQREENAINNKKLNVREEGRKNKSDCMRIGRMWLRF